MDPLTLPKQQQQTNSSECLTNDSGNFDKNESFAYVANRLGEVQMLLKEGVLKVFKA